ncbi:UNVERIFIED_ORG: hypothetical protein OKW25_000695 [Pseudomonas vranovensis]|nr:hypothetical protein [Pseudomonas vranovensis]
MPADSPPGPGDWRSTSAYIGAFKGLFGVTPGELRL